MGQAADSFPDDPILARAGRGPDFSRLPDEGGGEPEAPAKPSLVPPPREEAPPAPAPVHAAPEGPPPVPDPPPAQPPFEAEPLEEEPAIAEAYPEEHPPVEPLALEPPTPVARAPLPAPFPTPARDEGPLVQELADAPQGMIEHEEPISLSDALRALGKAGQPWPTQARRAPPDKIVGKEAPLELPRREPPRPRPVERPALEREVAAEPPRAPEPPPTPTPALDPVDLDEGIPWAPTKPLTIHPRPAAPAHAPPAASVPQAEPARQAQIIPHPASARSAAPEPEEPEQDDEDPLAGWTPKYIDIEEERPMRKQSEPIVQQILGALRENRLVQLAAGGVVLIIVALIVFQPWAGAPGVSLRDLKRNPSRYSDRSVRVRGRVGEVFPMGNGFTFYLLQGRDTMAVFTRSRTPLEGERIDIVGTVQPGVLDGQTRLALFEQVR